MKRLAAAVLGALLLVPTFSLAQQEFVFGVNEGVTYRITPHETRDRYKELAELLSKTLKRPVKIAPQDNYPKLQKALEDKQSTSRTCIRHTTHTARSAIKATNWS